MLLIFFMTCNLHNSFIRTQNLVFLDSMESSLNLESGHVPVNDIRGHIFFENLIVASSVQIAWL